MDAEGDGLFPTKIHVLSCTKNGNVFSTNDYEQMRAFLLKADVIVAHNIVRFDVPVLERILGLKIKAKVIDTLILSWYLFPERTDHGLEDWGETFGIPKPKILDWENLSYEEYKHRCEEDVKINYKLWKHMWMILNHIYENKEDLWKFLEYLTFKMYCARLQEESGWKLDVKFVEDALVKLTNELQDKHDALSKVMPKVPVIKTKTVPKQLYKQDGTPTKFGQTWLDMLASRNLPADTEEIKYEDGFTEPNPGSHDQIKKWLFNLGWIPETHKIVKDKKTGEVRQIPQISKEKQKGGGVCDSIKKLYEKEPALELLDGLFVISHRIGILSGFLRDNKNGWLKAKIAGVTNTLRFKHAEIVNLPKVNVPYGYECRGSLVAQEGFELLGADMTSLEDRLKQHYIYPYDPDYVKEMNVEGFDPHLDIALLGKRVSPEEAQAYKTGNKDFDLKAIKKVRDIFKNVNYAGQYGAGAPRIALTGGISLDEAKSLHKIYWERNWSIKEAAKDQIFKTVNGQMWLFNPINRFWYSLREKKDIFSTLVQGTASYVFDRWLQFILEERPQLTAQFHDEIVLCIRKGFREEAKALCYRALDKLNKELNLNRRLDIGVQFDDRYSGIH